MKESGVINKTALVYGQMNGASHARRSYRPYNGWILRDVKNKTCSCSLITSSALSKRVPKYLALLRSYAICRGQPTLANDVGALQERITSTKRRFYYLRTSRIRTCRWLDRILLQQHSSLGCDNILSRSIVNLYLSGGGSSGFYKPYFGLTPHVLGEEHYAVARGVQEVLQNIAIFKILSQSSVWKNCLTKINSLYLALVRFNVSESTILRSRSIYWFSGKYVPLSETLRGFREILDGKRMMKRCQNFTWLVP